jgi:hypothetical protein
MACKRCGQKRQAQLNVQAQIQIPSILMTSKSMITVSRGKGGALMPIRVEAFNGKYAQRLIKSFGTIKVVDCGDLNADEIAALVAVCKQLGIDVAEKYLNNATSAPAPTAQQIDLVAERAAKLAATNESKDIETGVSESVSEDAQATAEEKPKRGRKPKQ